MAQGNHVGHVRWGVLLFASLCLESLRAVVPIFFFKLQIYFMNAI
jgi:hypothetical protein